MPESCETCRFWRRFRPARELVSGISEADGVCRRYAATKYHPCAGDNPFPNYGSPWPWVAHDQWCGEYVKGEAAGGQPPLPRPLTIADRIALAWGYT